MRKAQRHLAEGILFTDEYQFTMAQLYFRLGLHERLARFEHFFRTYPNYGVHQAGYCVNAGLEWLVDWLSEARFGETELACLHSQTDRTGKQLFAEDFLNWLREQRDFSSISLDAIPEGRVVHPGIPITVVQGPMAMAQILETPLLNCLNFQTLIATKAARMRESGRDRPILEFGARRAQDGAANAGARAALIGGADFTSNVGISHVLGLPAKGTHAHSMVQAMVALGEGELGAFRAYADLYPDDCLLLVDTINTLESGVPNAIKVFEELRQRGHKPVGIRLDSGDLAYLSIQAAKMLDTAGFPDTTITLSGDLDELVIWQIITQIEQEAPRYNLDADATIKRLMFGVGTRLITSAGEAALNGVYKLMAIQKNGDWLPTIKISDTPAKTITPGNKTIWRIYDQRGIANADLATLEGEEPDQEKQILLRHPIAPEKSRILEQTQISAIEPLLKPVLKEGSLVMDMPSLEGLRARCRADIEKLDPGVRRLINPHTYHVSLSAKLWDLKQELTESARNH